MSDGHRSACGEGAADGRSTGRRSQAAKETRDVGVGTAEASEPPARHRRPRTTYSRAVLVAGRPALVKVVLEADPEQGRQPSPSLRVPTDS